MFAGPSGGALLLRHRQGNRPIGRSHISKRTHAYSRLEAPLHPVAVHSDRLPQRRRLPRDQTVVGRVVISSLSVAPWGCYCSWAWPLFPVRPTDQKSLIRYTVLYEIHIGEYNLWNISRWWIVNTWHYPIVDARYFCCTYGKIHASLVNEQCLCLLLV